MPRQAFVAFLFLALLGATTVSGCLSPENSTNATEGGVPTTLPTDALGDAISVPALLVTNKTLGDFGLQVSASFGEGTSGTCKMAVNATGRLSNNRPQLLTLARGFNRNGEYVVAGGGFNAHPVQVHAADAIDTRTVLTQDEDWWAFRGTYSFFSRGPGNFTFFIGANGVELPPPDAPVNSGQARTASFEISTLCANATAVTMSQARELTLFWDQNVSGGIGMGTWATRTSVSMMDAAERVFASDSVSVVMFVQDPQRTLGTITVETPNASSVWSPPDDGRHVVSYEGGPGRYRVSLSIASAQPVYGIMAGLTPVRSSASLGPANS